MVTLNRLFAVAAAVCFAIAVLLALGAFHGGNQDVAVDSGLLAIALAMLA